MVLNYSTNCLGVDIDTDFVLNVKKIIIIRVSMNRVPAK